MTQRYFEVHRFICPDKDVKKIWFDHDCICSASFPHQTLLSCFTMRKILILHFDFKQGCMSWWKKLWSKCVVRRTVATLLWAKCGGEAQHSQSWGLGVLRDSWMFRVQQQGSKHLELGCSWCHWVLKLRYRKWPRIGHLDICSPSYGQKKGRESNWQFDPRPLKVGNWPVHWGSATRRWKDLNKGYNIDLDLVPIRG
jgi:hypothetical protein